jgi:hypothetical protein
LQNRGIEIPGLCAFPKILSLSVLFGPGPQGARIGRSFQSVSEARPKKIESNILFGKKGWFVNLKGCWFLLFGSTLVVKKQEKDSRYKNAGIHSSMGKK